MTITEQIWDGLDLMLIGMGTVFLFLTMLVVVVMLMSKLAGLLEARWSKVPLAAAPPAAVPADHVAAISAALHRYRSTDHSIDTRPS